MSIIVQNGVPFKTDLVVNGKRQWGLLLEVPTSAFTTNGGSSKISYDTGLAGKNFNACKVDVKSPEGLLVNNPVTELSSAGVVTTDPAELSTEFQNPNNVYYIYLYYLETEV